MSEHEVREIMESFKNSTQDETCIETAIIAVLKILERQKEASRYLRYRVLESAREH